MTKDAHDSQTTHEPDTPAAPRPDGPRASRGSRTVRGIVWTLAGIVLTVALVAALALAAVTSERGTRIAWAAAVRLLGGHLSGTLEGGALSTGVRIRSFAWTSPDGQGTEVRIDRIAGRWALTRAPLRLTIADLRAGTIDLRIAPGPSKPAVLPQSLALPLQLRIDDLRIDRLTIHDAGSTTVLDNLALNGRSDGRHHQLALRRLDTPFGALTA